jgi:hypothetical protein
MQQTITKDQESSTNISLNDEVLIAKGDRIVNFSIADRLFYSNDVVGYLYHW